MSKISFNIRSRLVGAHIFVHIWAGDTPGSRGKCGMLTMKPEEWEVLRDILKNNEAVNINNDLATEE